MLTSATRGETLTPNPNECNSTLTSVTRGTYPYPDTYTAKLSKKRLQIETRLEKRNGLRNVGHRLGMWVTGYEFNIHARRRVWVIRKR